MVGLITEMLLLGGDYCRWLALGLGRFMQQKLTLMGYVVEDQPITRGSKLECREMAKESDICFCLSEDYVFLACSLLIVLFILV